MSESQVELDNCRACDEDEFATAVITAACRSHLARRDGICAVCSEQVFDPAKIRRVLDQINQGAL